MRRKSALRAHTDRIQGLFSRLSAPLGNEVCGLVDPRNHFIFVLEFGEFGRYDAEDDVLVLWKVGEGLETASTRCVVFKVVCVDVEVLSFELVYGAIVKARRTSGYLEELLGDDIVRTLREVTATNIVAAAEMDTDVHVFWSLEALVVELNVGIEHLIGSLVISFVGFPALEHGV
jgi:hypothetical protein